MTMPGFYGLSTVIRRRDRMRATGKVFAGTLNVRGDDDTMTAIAYEAVYPWPISEQSGLGSDTSASQRARITAFQVGETEIPRADDTWTVEGHTYLINSVETECNADSGYAIHNCECSRTP